jgi:hypothetical protein
MTPWTGNSPPTNGKSLSTGPRGPTPKAAVVIASNTITFFHMNFDSQIHRPTDSVE